MGDDLHDQREWITIHLTRADVTRASRGKASRAVAIAVLALLAWMVVAAFVLVAIDRPIGYMMSGAFVVIILLTAAVSPRRRARDASSVTSEVRISPAGFESRSRTHTTWRGWDDFDEVVELPDLICLRVSPFLAELVPIRSFSKRSDAEVFLRDARHWIEQGSLQPLDPLPTDPAQRYVQ